MLLEVVPTSTFTFLQFPAVFSFTHPIVVVAIERASFTATKTFPHSSKPQYSQHISLNHQPHRLAIFPPSLISFGSRTQGQDLILPQWSASLTHGSGSEHREEGAQALLTLLGVCLIMSCSSKEDWRMVHWSKFCDRDPIPKLVILMSPLATRLPGASS